MFCILMTSLMLQIIHVIACPMGSSQIGPVTSYIDGSIILTQTNSQTAEQCGQRCALFDQCQAFSYLADAAGTSNECTLYSTDAVTGSGGSNAMLCRPLECPADSAQIGVWNADISTSLSTSTVIDIDACDVACTNNVNCVSYAFAPSSGTCKLFGTLVPDSTSVEDQILCKQKCMLESGYVGVPWAWGDPHFGTYQGYHHHFQGPNSFDGDSYYLIKNCDTNNRDTMPFALSMMVFPWGNINAMYTVIEYLVLELFVGPDPDTDTYYFFIGTIAEEQKYAQLPAGTTRRLADIESGPYANRLTQLPVSNTWMEFGANKDNKVKFNFVWPFIYVNMELSDGSQTCTPGFWLRYQGRSGYIAAAKRGYIRHHRVETTEVSRCYLCETCGLFGDFHTTRNYMQTCDGSAIYLPTWDRNPSSSSTNNYRKHPDGWGWGTEYVDNNCVGAANTTDRPPLDTACNDEVKIAAMVQCQEARDNATACCTTIGGNYCDAVQYSCEIDVCATAVNDVSMVSGLVEQEFANQVQDECDKILAPVPRFLWTFDGDLTETITSNPTYTLNLQGDAMLEANGLSCNGINASASGQADFSEPIGSHSIELLVTLEDLERGGAIMSAIVPATSMSNEMFETVGFSQFRRGKGTGGSLDNRRFSVVSELFRDSASTRNNLVTIFESVQWNEGQLAGPDLTYVVATFDVAGREIILYRNGVEMFRYSTTRFLVTDGQTGFQIDFCSGVNYANLEQDFHGLIHFGAVYDTVLTAAQIDTFYRQKVLQQADGNFTNFEILDDELLPGERVYGGQVLQSDDGGYNLILTRNGNLKIEDASETILYETGRSNAAYLEYTNGGALVLKNRNDGVVQRIFNANSDAGRVMMQSDGRLVAYSSSNVEYDSLPVAAAAHQGVMKDDIAANDGFINAVDYTSGANTGDKAHVGYNRDLVTYAFYAAITLLLFAHLVVKMVECMRQPNSSYAAVGAVPVKEVGIDDDSDTEVEPLA